MTDPLTGLATLRSTEPSAARAARIRQRCHAELAHRSRRPAPRPALAGRRGASPLWLTLVAGLCAVYLAEVVVLAVGILGSR